MNRNENMDALLDELALLVDGDRDALAKHADVLAEDDDARDLKYDAERVAARIAHAGADYLPPADLEAKLFAALDARAAANPQSHPNRTTSPGFVIDPRELARASVPSAAAAPIGHAPVAPTTPFGPADGPETPKSAHDDASRRQGPTPQRGDTSGSAPSVGRVAKIFVLFGAVGLAAAAALGLAILRPDLRGRPQSSPVAGRALAVEGSATSARITTIVRASDGGAGVEVRPAGGAWTSVGENAVIPAGASVRTDERTRVRLALSDGSELVLNHGTELRFDAQAPRRFEIPEGEVLADVAHLEGGPNASFTVPTGRIEVLGTKFVLSATPQMASVRVTRGSVRVESEGGGSVEVKAGEEGVLRAAGAPEVSPVMDLARSVAWSELSNDVDDEPTTLPGIGSLRARRPGEREDRERPLHLARHEVRVRIAGNVARTEIEEVFRNDSDQTLEGIYRFPLPSDAQIARLALDVDGTLQEGSFVARERAARIWRGVIRNATPVAERRPTEEYIWVPGPWRDPALLEWQRGGQFELRIFPIPAHGERRVVLAYTQVIPPQAEGRRYVYPLAHSRDESTRIGELVFDVRIAGARAVRPNGYRVSTESEDGAIHLRYAQSSFRPNGDLVIDYELADEQNDLSYWTYQGQAAQAPPDRSRDPDREVVDLQRRIASDERPFVAFALRPRLPVRTERRARDYVIVVDSSQSMVGERFQRAARLVAGVVAEMDRRDRFAVLACDYECRSMEGTAQGARMRTPTAAEARAVAQWLASVEPAGASDLVATLRTAARVVGERAAPRTVHVLYVGDGIASVGHRGAGAIASEVARLVERHGVAFTTVGIGTDADADALAAIARAGGGHFVPFVPGQRSALAALSVLETTYGVALRDATLVLPEGLVEVAPAVLPTIRAGEEVIVTARMARPEVRGEVVLRGTVGGESFEQRYPVHLVPSSASGNLFVPALWASRTIRDLELADRGEDEARIVALSRAFSVLSRHTSLLVLESDAMFRAFGVDRVQAPVPRWTGEEEAEQGGSVDALASDEDADDAADDAAGPGSFALGGRGSGGRVARRRIASSSEAMPNVPLRMEAEALPDARASSVRNDTALPAATPVRPMPSSPVRPQGRWMRRVYYRTGEIRTDAMPTFRELEQARLAEEALRAQPDSRDRHRAAVRAFARVGNLERALEVAEAWFSRDRLDPEALVARADVLARLGRRDEALRVLTGTVDLRPDDAALHERLAAAFERAGNAARSCAHRVAIAEVRNDDANAVGRALRCERMLGDHALAEFLFRSIRDEAVRARAERVANEAVAPSAPRGEILVEASWPGGDPDGDDVDVALIAPDGSRLSWMGGRTTIVGRDAFAAGREQIGLRTASVGQYAIEVARTRPDDRDPIHGQLRVRAFDAVRTIPFVLRGDEERASVARIIVRRESRLVPVEGSW